MTRQTVAVVPVRSLTGGKTRIASTVPPEAREALTRAMLTTVLEAVSTAGTVDRVIVVSPSPEALQFALDVVPAIEPLLQPLTSPGLIPALEQGRAYGAAMGAQAILIIFGDLPGLQAADVRVLTGLAADVVIAPDRCRDGTNALLLRDRAISSFSFHFGESSFPRHIDEAERRQLTVGIVERPGTQLDLDTPDDLALLPTPLSDLATGRIAL